MQLYLQFGHGMMDHTVSLLKSWRSGGVVLSPRDLDPGQLLRVSLAVSEFGVETLLDPQCYLRDADHPRLLRHDYWKAYRASSTANLLTVDGARNVIAPLGVLNRSIGATRHILPGILASAVDDDWFVVHESFIAAGRQEFEGEPLLATIALSDEVVRDERQIEAIIERAAEWEVGGFYVVGEAPSPYLIDDPVWLANMLILASGLKLLKKFVLVGYSSHQMLGYAAGNVDAIAAGTWLNVRAFPTAKFYIPDEDDISRRTTWYYCPQVLSEYKLPFLDIAQRQGVLAEMRPSPQMGSTYADTLFAGAQPSSVQWGERDSFRHYLTCLRAQCGLVSATGFDQAMSAQSQLLNTAEAGLRRLRSLGVYGNDRDFLQVLDANRGALAVFQGARGTRLRREW